MKSGELLKRGAYREKAKELYDVAKKAGDVVSMKKYSSANVQLNKEIIEDAKKLISLLGCPFIQAPSEAEAQATFLVKKAMRFLLFLKILMFCCLVLLLLLEIFLRIKILKVSVVKTLFLWSFL